MQNDGQMFERSVFELLALKGAQNLSRERQFSSKKVDLYFEESSFGGRRRFAVECKDFSRTLTQANLAEIKAGYDGLLRDSSITNLLVVSNGKLAAGAQSYVDSIPELSHMTIEDLRNSIIDLRGYLNGLKQRFSADPTFEYFVTPAGRVKSDAGEYHPTEDLVETILAELGQTRLPFAVLGAYGIGKTTLARKLFIRLLEDREEDSTKPIPIYIALHRMMREQSLEGLLGGIFTAVSPSPGYNFDLFCALNERGHFVLILDGLDEMRHRLTWDEFEFNVSQLSQLTSKNPSSLILGRPTTFMDQREYQAVIHGGNGNESSLEFRGSTSYREIQVDLLDRPRITEFIRRFCAWKYTDDPRMIIKVERLLNESATVKFGDIISRPVQLMMFLEIFPQLPSKIDGLTQATVYSLFVDELIRREKKKDVRRSFSPNEHREFGQRVAWWLWLRGGEGGIEASQIGRDVLEPFTKPTDNMDIIRRDLVSSSFLTTEGGAYLGFPHRSLQEYFVSEHLAVLAGRKGALSEEFRRQEASAQSVLTPEVVEFLAPQLSVAAAEEVIGFLDEFRIVPRNSLELMASSSIIRRTVFDRLQRTGGVVCAWLCVHEATRQRQGPVDAEFDAANLCHTFLSLIQSKRELIARGPSSSELVAISEQAVSEVASYLLCLLVVSGRFPESAPFVLSGLAEVGQFQWARVSVQEGTRKNEQSRKRTLSQIPFATDFESKLAENLFGERLSIDWIYKYLRSKARASPFVPEWTFGESIQVPGIDLPTQFSLRKYPSLRGRLEELRKLARLVGEARTRNDW